MSFAVLRGHLWERSSSIHTPFPANEVLRFPNLRSTVYLEFGQMAEPASEPEGVRWRGNSYSQATAHVRVMQLHAS